MIDDAHFASMLDTTIPDVRVARNLLAGKPSSSVLTVLAMMRDKLAGATFKSTTVNKTGNIFIYRFNAPGCGQFRVLEARASSIYKHGTAYAACAAMQWALSKEMMAKGEKSVPQKWNPSWGDESLWLKAISSNKGQPLTGKCQIMTFVAAALEHVGGFDLLLEAVRVGESSPDAFIKRRQHAIESATENIRPQIAKLLENGLEMDEIVEIVKEEVVKSVQSK